jgi:hypothetical protein
MKRTILLLAPVLVLGIFSGAALVVACGGSTRADAQVGGLKVVDGSGAILGTFLGIATAWGPDPGGSGLIVPSGEIFALQDASGRIWHVGANGIPRQPEMPAFYASAGCTGAVYLQFYAVQGVAHAAGSYWTVAATESTVSPASVMPPGGACAPSTGTMSLRLATAATAPTATPPLRVQ